MSMIVFSEYEYAFGRLRVTNQLCVCKRMCMLFLPVIKSIDFMSPVAGTYSLPSTPQREGETATTIIIRVGEKFSTL